MGAGQRLVPGVRSCQARNAADDPRPCARAADSGSADATRLVTGLGWVANRDVRIGVLVHDSDDPNGKEPKSSMGVWRTAADAGEDCTSLATFVTEPQVPKGNP